MSNIEIQVQSNANPEMVSDALENLGALAVTFSDAADQPLFEPEPDTMPLWRQTVLSALFDADTDSALIQSSLKQQFAEFEFTFTNKIIADQDWERVWMDSFVPMQFGKKLWICPTHCSPPAPDAINILLDPGLAFGTGTHPTTRLCLEWLEQQDLTDKTVIDYGCGSGILAIAALKLGAKQAFAIDIEPQALDATLENARRNAIEPHQIRCLFPEEFERETAVSAEILIANILAQPLIDLAPVFAKSINTKGTIALSGLLVEQIAAVAAAYEPYFDESKSLALQDWALINFYCKD